jgi:DNA-binding transcriptional LysR family regulator
MIKMYDMHVDYLARVDLNLVGPLAALLEERHVSRAAERVGITQPAMSHALRRLRSVLGDELLVRGTGGYVLTPRAERLQRQLVSVVPQLEVLFADELFDPATAVERFHIAGTDYPAFVLGPSLSKVLLGASPLSTLRFSGWSDRIFEDLVHGALDLAFYGSTPPSGLHAKELFEERFVCVVDADHPLADHIESVSLDEYLGCSHVSVEIVGGEQAVIDHYLQRLGTPRRITLRVPYHFVAARVLPGTSLVATLPAKLVAQVGIQPGLRVVPAPVEIETMSYVMVWHPRLDDDPAQSWLRELLGSIADGLTGAIFEDDHQLTW